jgi:uncharacterized protein RhaS with RHS repeats
MGYSPTLGRWLEEDPAGYVDGANLYQMELGNPVLYTDPTGTETVQERESRLWQDQQGRAQKAFDYWAKFLDLRMGNNTSGGPISDDCKKKFMLVIRAISWVESQHGTAGAQQPGSDPIQSGNPNDTWWQTLLGNKGNGDRFIGGPNVGKWWASELPGATGYPVPKNGHNDAAFNADLSYFWGVPYLIHLINKHNGKTYTCGKCDLNQMLEDAAAYNGQGRGAGDPEYLNKLKQAVKLIQG